LPIHKRGLYLRVIIDTIFLLWLLTTPITQQRHQN
jgi:hypothetical protein